MNAAFEQVPDEELARLIAEAPLCWIVPQAQPPTALLMPVLLERDEAGRPASLLGHLPRGAPATGALHADGRASFLFLGPNRYISPSMAGAWDWAPTWNFVSAHIDATVEMSGDLTREAVEALVRQMEGPQGWTTDELGPRYEDLLARIVGFRAEIGHVAPRFKLGQDESDAVLRQIGENLAGTPLGDWMGRGTSQ